ncbi:hypothetical protein BZG02_18915 [Labilibaculum filiforme]|uniref:Uncharacterized protein n=1 Tax=Labilibaculum filiforme TaxID=1940526 RepID=A0A2N3HR62_9BACT|nr:hypothetical protein [Labilibaculum filiforme]PKQ60537.1 hypothetical protein BZG02_18915 [Labilibaculum filiforme]
MKNILILVVLFLANINQIDAQLKLKTPEGKVVLLFDNGTWKYEETAKVEKTNVPIKLVAETEKPITLIDAELELQTVIKGVSAKLSKFSKTNNEVKADFQIISKEGKVFLKTNWKLMDAEGFRFFGYITKKSKMLFALSNGERIELQYEGDAAPKEYPKYKFTTFTAELELNEAQIRKLQNAYLETVEMYWSRRTESYEIFNPDYFVKELPKIMK